MKKKHVDELIEKREVLIGKIQQAVKDSGLSPELALKKVTFVATSQNMAAAPCQFVNRQGSLVCE